MQWLATPTEENKGHSLFFYTFFYRYTDVSANNRYQTIKAMYFTIGNLEQSADDQGRLCPVNQKAEKHVRLQLILCLKQISVEFRAVKINVKIRH